MVKARTWLTLFMLSVGTIAATASCGSDEATGGSAGGGSIISGGGNAGHGASAGAAGSTATGNNASLGIECADDGACGPGLTCVKANSTLFGSGGPSGGMCTLSCTSSDQCAAVKGGSECFNFGTQTAPQGFCLDSCEQGAPLDQNAKCAGRSDFVCADLSDTNVPAGFCLPLCRSDAECGSNLFCDPRSGMCTKTKPPAGDPVGTPCDPSSGAAKTCTGVCFPVSDTEGACVQLCSFGSECMYGSGNDPSPGGFCLGALSSTPGLIDLGYCRANCSCSSDCPLPGELCRKWTDTQSELADLLGAPGMCYPVVAESVELSCGEGGAGGAGGTSGAGEAGAGGTRADGGAAGND